MEDCRLHLLHLIASHHGEPQFGSPIFPKTPEALALNYIDNLDARLEMFFAGYPIAKPLAARIFERVRPLPGNLVKPLEKFSENSSEVEHAERSLDPALDLAQIFFVDFEADEARYARALRRHRGISNSEKRIEHSLRSRQAVEPNAIRRQLDRKCRGMRSLLRATLDCFVRNEPGVAAATPVTAARVAPARDVRLVGVGNAEREAVERRLAFWREMENIFVAIVQKARRTDRLEMARAKSLGPVRSIAIALIQ